MLRLLRRVVYAVNPWRRQTCKDCWRAGGLDFHVPDEVWQAVVPGRTTVLCLDCFDRRAEAARVDYSPTIRLLGRQCGILTLRVE